MRASQMRDVAKSLSYPGIDPREWIKLGLVTDVSVTDEGVFLEVEVQPEGWACRAKLLSIFAGAGWGAYYPVQVGDQTVVIFPDGHPQGQCLALGTLHTSEDAVSSEAQGDSETVWIVTRSGQDVRVKAAGNGNVWVESSSGEVIAAAPTVRLGSASASAGIVCRGFVCPMNPYTGHIQGSSKVFGE